MTKRTAERLLALLTLVLGRGEVAEQSKPTAPSSQDATLYAAVLRHYLHQDSMLWSRVQLLIAIQAGVLGGSVAFRKNGYLAASVLILGAFFTLLLFFLARKDELDRDLNLPLLDALARRITTTAPFQGIQLDPVSPIRLASRDRPWHVPFRGRTILWLSIVLLLMIDLVLALGYISAPALMARLMVT